VGDECEELDVVANAFIWSPSLEQGLVRTGSSTIYRNSTGSQSSRENRNVRSLWYRPDESPARLRIARNPKRLVNVDGAQSLESHFFEPVLSVA
jgi:hypothetical protein